MAINTNISPVGMLPDAEQRSWAQRAHRANDSLAGVATVVNAQGSDPQLSVDGRQIDDWFVQNFGAPGQTVAQATQALTTQEAYETFEILDAIKPSLHPASRGDLERVARLLKTFHKLP